MVLKSTHNGVAIVTTDKAAWAPFRNLFFFLLTVHIIIMIMLKLITLFNPLVYMHFKCSTSNVQFPYQWQKALQTNKNQYHGNDQFDALA